jgi:chromate transporter
MEILRTTPVKKKKKINPLLLIPRDRGLLIILGRVIILKKAAPLPKEVEPPVPSLRDIFLTFFKIGFTAFGPAMMAETKKIIVMRKGWLKEQEFLDGLALAQFLPGATFVTLTVFMGYRIRRLAGAAASFAGFLLPPFTLMVLLSALYFRYSGLSLVETAFRGVEAVVVALIANAVLDLGRSVIKDRQTALVAVVSLVVAWFKQNIFINILIAVVLGVILFVPWKEKRNNRKTVLNVPKDMFHWRETAVVLAVTGTIAALSSFYPLLLDLEGVFFRIGFLVFGNGFTMIPLIQQEVVDVHHWLDLSQFTAGIALGQITPGPIVITATYVGYKVAGFWGALAATGGIFAPCFILVMLVMPIYKKIKGNPWIKAVFNGVLASFVGLMIMVVVGMARHSLTDPATVVLSLAALTALRLTKLDVLWVVLGGTGVYLLVEKISNLAGYSQ